MLDVRYHLLVELGGLRNESDGAASVVTFCGREDALARVHSFVRSFVPKVIQSQVRPVPVQIREGWAQSRCTEDVGGVSPMRPLMRCCQPAVWIALRDSRAVTPRRDSTACARATRECADSAPVRPSVRCDAAGGSMGPGGRQVDAGQARHIGEFRFVTVRNLQSAPTDRSARTYPMLSYPSVHAVSDAASRWLANPAPL